MSACRRIRLFNPRWIFPARIHILVHYLRVRRTYPRHAHPRYAYRRHTYMVSWALAYMAMAMTVCWNGLAMFIQCDVSSPLGDLRVRTFSRKRRTGSCLPMASSSSIWITHARARARISLLAWVSELSSHGRQTKHIARALSTGYCFRAPYRTILLIHSSRHVNRAPMQARPAIYPEPHIHTLTPSHPPTLPSLPPLTVTTPIQPRQTRGPFSRSCSRDVRTTSVYAHMSFVVP